VPGSEGVAATMERTMTGPEGSSLEDDVRRRRLKAQLFGVDDPPIELGRYTVESTLGEGAMGVVYSARDSRLDRTVALKVLRAEHSSGPPRIEREARALAKLAHPNVVSIHEVGDAEGHTYIAMEHVRGPTLRAWMAGEHPIDERLDMVRQAARGLAAAHELGIVHRDFKPDNAIVGEDGRLRVVDFGLATSPGEAEALETLPPTVDREPEAGPWARMTATGLCLGTPAYMAPELRAGEPPSPGSDQFALCVSAWEVLFGHHPLVGREDGTPAPVPKGSGVAPAIVEALRTGMAPDPAQRHADLTALLQALEAPPNRRLGWIAAMVALASIATAAVALRSTESESGEPAAVAPIVTECSLSFDDSRRSMRDSVAMAEEEMNDATLTATQRAQARERHGAIRIALGHWEEGCAELTAAFDGFGGSRARCWHARYCRERNVLPPRTRCFAGDVDACNREAIKQEYEWLEAKKGSPDAMANAAASYHYGLLVELLSAGCELGGEHMCQTLAAVSGSAEPSR